MYQLSGHAIKELFLKGEVSAESIVEGVLSRINSRDPEVSAFLSVFNQRAEQKAKELDQKRKDGKPLGKLAGIPIAIKDNIHVKGEITTCASHFLSNYKAPFDATLTRLLEEEDAIIIGKTNLDEFAMGSSTENSAYQLTKNPWSLDSSPGGSSGGSAAAVAARFCPIAFGSDTGGSIRQPAGFCGVTGFKPTYGRVSRYGLVAFASSLDQIGPFATNVKDIALIMETIGRHCEFDSTSMPNPPEAYHKMLENPIKGRKIGVPLSFLNELTDGTKANFLASLEHFKQMGAHIVDIDLDILKYSIAVYYILSTAEASTNLARFDGIRFGNRSQRATTLEEVYDFSRQEGFGPEVKNRILLGTYVLSSGYSGAYYQKAQKARTLIIQKLNTAFSKCDVIAMPTSPFTAFTLKSIHDPVQMYLQDVYTICANLAGLPAISIPSGFDANNKPFGLQIMGPPLHDGHVLNFAHAFEKATGFNTVIPPLFDEVK